MLFRIWQHALMNQPMTVQEIWHWVHVCYGDELGLASDEDEDHVTSSVLEVQNFQKLMASQIYYEENTASHDPRPEMEERERVLPVESPPTAAAKNQLPSQMDSSDESEEDKNPTSTETRAPAVPSVCPVKHDGRMLLKEAYPLSVDDLFTLIFTFNKFNRTLMESMKYTDINISAWEENPATGLKTRSSSLVVPVTQPIGPKTCQVKETQVIQPCSKPGELYVVEVEAVNSGVPYCDSFYITTHFCITSDVNAEAVFTVHCQIKYRKSVWGLVKSFIEKNVWAGLEDYFKALGKALEEECSRKQTNNHIGIPRTQTRESTKVTTSVPQPEVVAVAVETPAPTLGLYSVNDMALWAILGVLTLLVLFNALLFYKLSALQDFDKENGFSPTLDSHILNEQRTHEQWLKLLQKQAIQHQKEIEAWKNTLQSVVSLLKQAEESITNLQTSVLSAGSGRVVKALNSLLESDNVVLTKGHNEL